MKNDLLTILIILSFSFILSSSLVSANILSDVWNWVTGQATKDPPVNEGDTDFVDIVPRRDTESHLECRDEQCIIISGNGTDECATSLDCPVTRTICNEEEQCMRVLERGLDQCNSHADCEKPSHTECQNFSCVEIEGQGIGQCAGDFDCRVLHTECNEDGQCIKVEGPGESQCEFNVDCEKNLECIDFDTIGEFSHGKNPFLKSETSDGKLTTEDWCSKVPEILIEYYCDSDKLRETSIDCESLGNFECANGECIQRPNAFQRFLKRIFGF